MRRVALPRVLPADVAARADISRGRTRSEIRRGNWQRLASGLVLTRPDEPTREGWADVGVALAGPGSALTGWDAVRARGLGDRRPPTAFVVVLSPTAMNRVVGAVRVRRTGRPFTRHIQPLGAPFELTPLVGVARAVADTALEHAGNANAVRALVSAVLQRRAGTIAELLDEYRAGPRNRSGALRVAVSTRSTGRGQRPKRSPPAA